MHYQCDILLNSVKQLFNSVKYFFKGGIDLKREDMISEVIKIFMHLNRARTFIDFQFYLKGENFLLSYLNDVGGESTPGILAEHLDVSPARVAAILRTLELKKLIIRKADVNDKRRTTVKITPKGVEWVNAAQSQITQNAISLIDSLGEEDANELFRILNKIIKSQSSSKDTPLEMENPPNENENFEDSQNQ